METNPFNPPTLLPKRPDPGPPTQRFCIPCGIRYTTMMNDRHCPVCGETETFPVEPDVPRQQTLFVVPPPPSPNAWIVEWRWKPKTYKILSSVIDPAVNPPNDWVRYSIRNITTERQAVNEVARLRRAFPAKSYRVTPVNWEPVPLLP